jgi:hypothetical protein
MYYVIENVPDYNTQSRTGPFRTKTAAEAALSMAARFYRSMNVQVTGSKASGYTLHKFDKEIGTIKVETVD